MKLRNTLVLLALVAGILAYIKWIDHGKLSSDEMKEIETKPAQFIQEKVTALTVHNRDKTIQFSQKDNVWRMESPLKDRAQDFALKGLLSDLEALHLVRVSKTPPTRDQLKEYGLLKPDLGVKIEADKPLDISFGNETPLLEGTCYVKVEGRDLVYMAKTSLRDTLAKKVDDWRNRTLSEILPQNVRQVTVKTAKGEMQIVKAGRYWSLAKPLKARADLPRVSDLLSDALVAQVKDFVTDAKDLGAFGLNEPRATLTFLADGSDTPVVLEIGAAKAAEKDDKKEPEKPEETNAPEGPTLVYVKITGRSGVVTVPIAIEKLITLQPNDLRDQNIMRIQEATVNRLNIEPAGKEKIILEKVLGKDQTKEEWVRKVPGKNDVPVNGGAASKLLTDLATGKSTKFIADMASDLKGFGLDQPQLTVSVGDFSSEGTPESAPGEREQAKLLLGRTEGSDVYAKLTDEPFIFTVPKTLVDSILTEPVLWQSLHINDFKRDEIVALEIKRIHQPPLLLDRDKDKGWKVAKGDGVVNQNAVQSLVNTIADLHATRWLGPTNPAAQGLETPNLIITYRLADKRTGKISLGSVSAENFWTATTEGVAGTFEITAQDFDALNAAIIETPKPAAEATPAPAGGKPGTAAANPAPAPVTLPPAKEAAKPAEMTKPTEAPPTGAKPAPESAPKAQP